MQLPHQRLQAPPAPARSPRMPEVPASRRHHGAAVIFVDLCGVGLLAGSPDADRRVALATALLWCVALAAAGGPRGNGVRDRSRARAVLLAGVGVLVGVAVWSYALDLGVSRRHALVVLPLVVTASALVRVLGKGRVPQRVLLVGTPHAAAPVRALLGRRDQQDVRVMGVCSPDLGGVPAQVGGVPVLGDLDSVAPVARAGGVDAVLVCSEPETAGPVLRRILWDMEGSGVPVLVAPGIVELGPSRLRLSAVAGLPVLGITDRVRGGPAWSAKRLMDRLVAAAGLAVLLPLLAIIGAAVRVSSPGPAVFRQQRIGQDGRTFTLCKFRTMHVGAEQEFERLRPENQHAGGPLFKIAEDPRVTRLGRLLRRTSLDELPQLWNVLRGDMSLVGPRPPLPSEVATYCDAVPRRLLVPPGMSGLWQVSGRSDLDWDESARLDLWYVENWSLSLDLWVLSRTVGVVLRGRGAY